MGRRQKEASRKEQMDISDADRVVYSDTSTGDTVMVTLASDYEKDDKDKGEKTQVNWTMSATQLFIASWVTRKDLFKRMPARDVYSLISSDLQEMGYDYSGEQCSIKWRSLKASFLKSKATMYTQDRPSNWIHYQAMAEALDEVDNRPRGHKRDRAHDDDNDDDNDYNDDYNNDGDEDDNDDDHQSDNYNVSNHSSPASPPPPPAVVPPRRRGRPPKRLQQQEKRQPPPPPPPPPPPKKKKMLAVEKASVKTKVKAGALMSFFSDMQDEWRGRQEERRRMHEERMELGRRKLDLMEQLITVLKRK